MRISYLSRAAHLRNICATFIVLIGGSASAHVGLVSPNEGGSLDGGFTFPIQWEVLVQHNTDDWDLWYSTTSMTGPWIEIAADLPKGDTSDGAMHSYNWQVPNTDISNAWVRVRQDNRGQDYYDVSSLSFNISAAEQGDFTGNGIANEADLELWESGFGTSTGALFAAGDDDSDGDVDGIDYLNWQSSFSNSSGFQASFIVPEPTSLFLFAMGAAALIFRQR